LSRGRPLAAGAAAPLHFHIGVRRHRDGRLPPADPRPHDLETLPVRRDPRGHRRCPGIGAADQLRSMEEHLYRDLLEGSIEGVYILDEAGIIRTANQAMADLFGYGHPGELIGQPGTILVAAPEREHLLRYYEARLRGEHAPRRHTFEAVRK